MNNYNVSPEKKYIVYFIPARGNSKAIPGKNKLDFNGKPLFWHSIEHAAMTIRYFRASDNMADYNHLILLSTEDNDIESYALHNYKSIGLDAKTFRIHHRPHHLAMDHVQTSEVMLNALRALEHDGLNVDKMVCLQPPSPNRDWVDITRCIEKHKSGTTFTAYRDNGFYWMRGEVGVLIPLGHNPARRLGRQWEWEKRSVLREDGSVYVVDAKQFSLETVMRFPPFTAVEVNPLVDIDEPQDWKKAVKKAKAAKP